MVMMDMSQLILTEEVDMFMVKSSKLTKRKSMKMQIGEIINLLDIKMKNLLIMITSIKKSNLHVVKQQFVKKDAFY
jgi:hypothetical protein